MSTWKMTDNLDISFEHCNKPAYWEGDNVYCSKCGDELPDTIEN
jgi:hypothetical protein